jgi:hypothetical protein
MMGSTNSCLLLCDSLAQCAPEKGACQSGWVCKIAESVQNFFDFLTVKFFTVSQLSCCEKCASLHQARIEILSVNPQRRTENFHGKDESSTGAESRSEF